MYNSEIVTHAPFHKTASLLTIGTAYNHLTVEKPFSRNVAFTAESQLTKR
jgi:hypothetical protein